VIDPGTATFMSSLIAAGSTKWLDNSSQPIKLNFVQLDYWQQFLSTCKHEAVWSGGNILNLISTLYFAKRSFGYV